MKELRPLPDGNRPLAVGRGACLATDQITVDGLLVGYMYREEIDFAEDSGWRFFSGHETQEYVDDPANTMVYDINTIANYDPAIVPYLGSNLHTAYERVTGTSDFIEVPFESSDE